jgi:hypothetical protein
MIDRPLKFAAPMVCALWNDQKFQTRRILPSQPPEGFYLASKVNAESGQVAIFKHPLSGEEHRIPLNIQIQDQIWVRETWSDVNDFGAPGIAYRADSNILSLMDRPDFLCSDGSFNDADRRLLFGKAKKPLPFADWPNDLFSGTEGTWRPAIFMPRWASRITLTVTDVRIERLQDISRWDAIAEGLHRAHEPALSQEQHVFHWTYPSSPMRGEPVAVFTHLWNSLHGPDAWDANPWIMALTFDVHKCNIDMMEAA